MAPEQARGEVDQIDERTDVYGLGGILHFLLTRRAPHEAETTDASLALARCGQVPSPRELVTEDQAPPLLCRIVERALAPTQQDRYPSVAALKRDVEAFLRGGGWFAQQTFQAGATIIREGDSADAAYIITSGCCELYKLGEHLAQTARTPRYVCELGVGEVFGETAIFAAGSRTGTIVAKTSVTVLVVTRAALERELDRSPWLGAFVRALARRFVDLDRQLNQRM
jgi:serine/threonine-protein kinase